jgi:hypothetical protein
VDNKTATLVPDDFQLPTRPSEAGLYTLPSSLLLHELNPMVTATRIKIKFLMIFSGFFSLDC